MTEDISSRKVGQNIIETVRQALPKFRRSERKVAERMLDDPRRVLHATLAEVAVLSDVSQPTVIRFCIAIGCSGYQEFKLRLAHSLALGTAATHSVLSRSDKTDTLVEKIFGYTMTSLDRARDSLDVEALDRAIALLGEARRIEFFGLGAANIVAQDAQQKFPLLGVPCGAQADSHQQLLMASVLQQGDVAVVFSNAGQDCLMIELAKTAKAGGAKVIAIAGPQSLLLHHCDVAIVIDALDTSDTPAKNDSYKPAISRIAAMVVVDVLSSAVGLRRSEVNGEQLRTVQQTASARLANPAIPELS